MVACRLGQNGRPVKMASEKGNELAITLFQSVKNLKLQSYEIKILF